MNSKVGGLLMQAVLELDKRLVCARVRGEPCGDVLAALVLAEALLWVSGERELDALDVGHLEDGLFVLSLVIGENAVSGGEG